MEAQIENLLITRFPPPEFFQIKALLDRGFCRDGQVAVASVFLFAGERGKSVEDVLAACEAEWKRSWNFQHPDICGSADAPGAAGIQNRASLENIYASLGIPSPMTAVSD